jgi:pyrroloquinoline quinone (PQQ) biosynthesis protein C
MDGRVLSRIPDDSPPPTFGAEAVHRSLAYFNRARLAPGQGFDPISPVTQSMLRLEEEMLCVQRSSVASMLASVPAEPGAFLAWFEQLKAAGPGQHDPLFPWLAEHATRSQLHWFLEQEVAGEAGFEDLLAMTQVKLPCRAKLEMARNFWDEMGRGREDGMHGPMLERLARAVGLDPQIDTTVPESLALGNTMVALAFNRRYAFHSIGALGVVELTAPTRAGYVAQALSRLGISRRDRHYFELHAVIDQAHSRTWNAEVIGTLVEEDVSRIRAIAEGALLRLWCGSRCFERYRLEFGVGA